MRATERRHVRQTKARLHDAFPKRACHDPVARMAGSYGGVRAMRAD